MSKFTDGPWFWVVNKKHKSVSLENRSHEVLRFERYGMQSAQPTFLSECKKFQGEKASDMAIEVNGREHHADWFMTIDHPDANLIASAPDLYEALQYCIDCLGDEFALPIDVIDQAEAALAKADGKG